MTVCMFAHFNPIAGQLVFVASFHRTTDAPAPSESPLDEIKNGLCDALDRIKAAGSFAAFAKLTESSLYPISVRDVGHVALPLGEDSAQQLIEKARQAPYGKGTEAFVDTSVRSTWVLDAAQLELHPHTEKIPGMFGALVICLPSEHQGGDLVVKQRDVTKMFKTSEVQPSMACWFSDGTHEVLPVTSGIRWGLTYNLGISPQVNRPSAAMNAPGLKLTVCITCCTTHTLRPTSLHSLKGADVTRMRCLEDVCDSLNATLLFGVIEKWQHGGCGYDGGGYYDRYDRRSRRGWGRYESTDEDDDEGDGEGWHELVDMIDPRFKIKKLATTGGNTLRENMEIEDGDLDKNLVQDYEDPFENIARGEEDYSGVHRQRGMSHVLSSLYLLN
ncbi:uncharacterized protein PODANS_6_6960 [Podospora anserina S mat+]|uniref:Podospora anserina S mat+ genomic DNA chromosome 6, supercontig 2 n=1 Tax=Podospora anserina (strain S / ATCC MYA-4624 / DSM 980 / FGSC 10383) TaxID=515849 RepID=B2B3Q8_PODAN|nr:uncharacterized protein PODANS_6_6960 [Podospora anserina S mat+]CAP71744.1 unnamed protein product [Podospora anserina S mat+]CDP31136.1 Putative protein of unknown function [Podospora anserina S mat+]